MKQLLNFITIGVRDLPAMKSFYTDVFGWSPLKDSDGIVFFKLNCFVLALYPVKKLADDIGIPQEHADFKGFTLSINFASKQEVDEAFKLLRMRNVDIVKEPQEVFWGGYSGYIADIENNYWELAYNPFLALDENGNVLSHS